MTRARPHGLAAAVLFGLAACTPSPRSASSGGAGGCASGDPRCAGELADAGEDRGLPPGQSAFCVYTRVTVTICGGGEQRPTRTETWDRPRCEDGPSFCAPPEGSLMETERCRVRSYHQVADTTGYRAEHRCADWERLQGGAIGCLIDADCLDGERCAGGTCACPPGATCGCLDSAPVQTRCEGDVFVDLVEVGQAADRSCLREARRTDCAARGQICFENVYGAACIDAEGAPAGVIDDGGVADAGATTRSDAGAIDAGTFDAGSPSPPPGPAPEDAGGTDAGEGPGEPGGPGGPGGS